MTRGHHHDRENSGIATELGAKAAELSSQTILKDDPACQCDYIVIEMGRYGCL